VITEDKYNVSKEVSEFYECIKIYAKTFIHSLRSC